MTRGRDRDRDRPEPDQVLGEIGRFRVVSSDDLARFQFGGDSVRMRHAMKRLVHRGLVRRHRLVSRRGDRLQVFALTRAGKERAESAGSRTAGERIYCELKKPSEIFHDAAIYRMFQAESARIRASGGRVRRVVLDFELKQEIYPELARARRSAAFPLLQQEIARRHGLKVVDGRIPLPDLRIEYETRGRTPDRVDLELATRSYSRSQIQGKERAGFRIHRS